MVRVNRDGTLIASCSKDHVSAVGEQMHPFLPFPCAILCLCVSQMTLHQRAIVFRFFPSSDSILCLLYDHTQTILIWNAAANDHIIGSSEHRTVLKDHDHTVECIAWAPESAFTSVVEATGGDNKRTTGGSARAGPFPGLRITTGTRRSKSGT